MPRPCCVCVDPRRDEIDRDIASGKSIPKIARAYGIPESNCYRHRKDHMSTPAAIAHSGPAGVVTTIETLQQRDKELAGVLGMAVTRGHTGAAVAALNQRIRVALEIANLRGEVVPQVKKVINFTIDRETAGRMAENWIAHQKFTEGKQDGE